MRSGTSRGLCVASLSAALRVTLECLCEVLSLLRGGELGTQPHPLDLSAQGYREAQPQPGPDEVLSTMGTVLRLRSAQTRQFLCRGHVVLSTAPQAALGGSPFINLVTLGTLLASLNFGFSLGFLSENRLRLLF